MRISVMPIIVLLLFDMRMVILMIMMITRRRAVRILVWTVILVMMMMIVKVMKLVLTDNSAPIQYGLFCLGWGSVHTIGRERTVG